MKKIIATAAGLMIAGSALVASAAVEFSGDARARYEYVGASVAAQPAQPARPATSTTEATDAQPAKASYNNSSDGWSHRVRIAVKADTAGGSFAAMRLRVAADWGTTGNISDNAASDITADYAYVGVPMGCTLVTAGRELLSLTTGYFNDVGIDNVRLTWANEATTLVGLYGVVNQEDVNYDTAVNEDGNTGKDDLAAVVWMEDWNEMWSSTVSLAYASFNEKRVSVGRDEIKDAMMGVVAVSGQLGPVALHTELGYQDKGVAASDAYYSDELNSKDAFGGFVTAGVDFDALGMTLVAGYSGEGYIFDSKYGFMLVGGDGQLALDNFTNVGALGDASADTYVVGLVTTYQATEDLGFLLNFGWVHLEDGQNRYGEDLKLDKDVFEVSGQAGYAVNDGTMLYARAGYVDTDDVIYEDAFAAGVSLELTF